MSSKKLIPFLLIISALTFFTACNSGSVNTNNEETSENSNETSSENTENTGNSEPEVTVTELSHPEDITKKLDYTAWLLAPEKLDFIKWQNTPEHQDCIGLENGLVGSGDLLSTLIADPSIREWANLRHFNPKYVKTLEQKIVSQTHNEYGSDLYAFKVCHVGDGVDVVAGYLWPQGTLAPQGKELSEQQNVKTILAISHPDGVQLHEDIQTVNNTATGAESYPCDVGLENNKVIWTCFTGLNQVEDGVNGGNYKSWTIPLNGEKITTEEFVE